MKAIPRQILREYISAEKFSSTAEVLEGMKGLFKQILEEAMLAELEEHLGYEKHQRSESQADKPRNYRNGSSKKTMKTELGAVELEIPRDRLGQFEPQIIPKHRRNAEGLEDKVIALYASGMTTRDISEQIRKLYDVEISADLVSKLTDRLLPAMREWQQRPLESVYPFVFLDAVHYKVREDRQVVVKAAYVALGVTLEGYREVLGIWVGQHESAKFWLGVLNDLKARGVKDIHLCCVDGLTGFVEAIQACYPKAKVQRCIVHQIRSSLKYVNQKDAYDFCQDLKRIYGATNEEEARDGLRYLKDKWEKSYKNAVKSWENNWEYLVTFYEYPVEVRRILYTTNAIEALHRQLRKVTKTRQAFPHDDSLLKMLYMAVQNIEQKRRVRIANWESILQQLEILFEGRMGP